MHFTCRSFIGTQNIGTWSQYWENEPDDLILIQKKGHLFGLISINQESQDSDVSTIGRDIIFEINQNYYSSGIEENILSCLKNSLLLIINNPLYNHISSIDIIISVVLNNRIYMAGIGSTMAILCRETQVRRILDCQSKEVSIIEGPLMPEDRLILMTKEFYEKIGDQSLRKSLSFSKIQALEENIMSGIYACEDQSGMASALIIPHSDTEIETAASVQEEVSDTQSEPVVLNNEAGSVKAKLFSKLFSAKPVFVSKCEINQISKRRRLNLAIIIILILALSVSSYLGYQKNTKQKKENQFQQLKSDLDSKISNAIAVKNLNLDSALQLAKESEDIWQQMKLLGIYPEETESYKKNVDALLTQTGSSEAPQLDMFYDTSLIAGGKRHYSSLAIKSNNLYLMDTDTGHVDSVDVSSKSIKQLSANEKNKGAQKLIPGNDNFYISKEDGIYLVNKNNVERKIEFSSDSSVVDTAFWNGAFYVIDAKSNNILKYTPNSTGFGAALAWLKEGEKMPENPTSITINGKVWLLTAEGKIASFLRGKAEKFNASQEVTATNARNIFTLPDKDILAFVDNENMVYVYKNNGESLSRFNLGQTKAKQIVIDNQGSSIYILGSDQKIYKINL